MFETLVDVFLDALIDSLKILPFLFGVYLLIAVSYTHLTLPTIA